MNPKIRHNLFRKGFSPGLESNTKIYTARVHQHLIKVQIGALLVDKHNELPKCFSNVSC